MCKYVNKQGENNIPLRSIVSLASGLENVVKAIGAGGGDVATNTDYTGMITIGMI